MSEQAGIKALNAAEEINFAISRCREQGMPDIQIVAAVVGELQGITEKINENKSTYRGHRIYPVSSEWAYQDTNILVCEDPDRPCGRCGLERTPEGHDPCLGVLPGVMNACCGHGEINKAYVQLSYEDEIRGGDALDWIATHRDASVSEIYRRTHPGRCATFICKL